VKDPVDLDFGVSPPGKAQKKKQLKLCRNFSVQVCKQLHEHHYFFLSFFILEDPTFRINGPSGWQAPD